MFDKARLMARSCGLSLLVALSAAPALAGGFGLSVQLPSDRTNSRTKDAVLLVRPEGCHGPGAAVSAAAEGIVNGRRQTVRLRLTPVATDKQGFTTYAVQRQWPAQGAWVLAIDATSRCKELLAEGRTATCRALLELGPNGSIPHDVTAGAGGSKELPIRYVTRESKEIETALQAQARRSSSKAAVARDDC